MNHISKHNYMINPIILSHSYCTQDYCRPTTLTCSKAFEQVRVFVKRLRVFAKVAYTQAFQMKPVT